MCSQYNCACENDLNCICCVRLGALESNIGYSQPCLYAVHDY